MPTILERARTEVTPYRRTVLIACVPVSLWAVWASGPGWTTPALVVAACVGVALFVIDVDTHRLPNALTYPTIVGVAVLLGLAALMTGDGGAALAALLGAAVLGGCYLLLHRINPGGLGFGDVKLAVLLGLLTGWYGWTALWATALLPFLLGGAVALVLIVARRATGKTAIAFGPFMLVGTAIVLTGQRVLAG